MGKKHCIKKTHRVPRSPLYKFSWNRGCAALDLAQVGKRAASSARTARAIVVRQSVSARVGARLISRFRLQPSPTSNGIARPPAGPRAYPVRPAGCGSRPAGGTAASAERGGTISIHRWRQGRAKPAAMRRIKKIVGAPQGSAGHLSALRSTYSGLPRSGPHTTNRPQTRAATQAGPTSAN